MDMVAGVIFFGLCIGLYLLPTIFAVGRNHPNRTAIFVLNLLLGWTLLGWVGAAVWAFTNKPALRPAPAAVVDDDRWQQFGAAVALNNPQPAATKLCPFCAEEVKAAALKCKHCGSEMPV